MIRLTALLVLLAATVAAQEALSVVEADGTILRFGPEQIADVAPVAGPDNGLALSVLLTPDAAKAFTALTERNLDQKIELVHCGEILVAPIIRSPIYGGRLLIAGGRTSSNLSRIGRSIREALPCAE